MKRLAIFLCSITILFSMFVPGKVHAAITFTAQEVLGCPTASSITVNVVPSSSGQIFFQYGKASGVYSGQTNIATLTSGTPYEVVISGLDANTQYYYRMRTSSNGGTTWVNGAEHSFYTQRATGSTFKFTVTADSHAQFNTAHQNAMTNILNEHPDFNIDLGDTFSLDGKTSQSAVNSSYLAYRNSAYMGKIGPSVPIFLASGNHEDEEGWNLDDTPFSIAVASIQARKAYFPTPVKDGFYTGNIDPLATINAAIYGDQNREDYYAWTWGDALFIVIDEFQYTTNLPYAPGTAGEGTDDPKTGDQWNWTLGTQQYQWLKETLQSSTARYKFIFSHQMLGGVPRSVGGVDAGYVRGGAEAAAYFEWGGDNADGTVGFNSKRPGWDKPVHQLMVDYGVSAYFHGHDHQFVYETRDGIVYQEVPSPSLFGSGFSGIYTAGNHGTYNTIKILPNSGHLLVTVTPDHAAVDYVSSSSTAGKVNYTYNITPQGQPAGTIAINDFDNYRVFQRDIGGTSKSVTITGTYADMNWSRIEARVLNHGTDTAVENWNPIDTTPGGGTFSGSLVVPQGGWYDIEVRAIDSVGTVLGSSRGSHKWGVGVLILCIGQSNMVGHGQAPYTVASSDLAVNYSNAGVWEHLADPYDDGSPAGAVDNDNSTAAGSMIPAIANSLLQTFNFPIAFVPSAKDGSSLYSQWAYRNTANHFDTTTLYGQSITKARNAGGVELIIMHQGEADTNAHRTEAQYKADFATLIGHYREDLYQNIPIFICQLGTIDLLPQDARTTADVQAVRNAQHDLDNGANVFMAVTAMELLRQDEVHYTRPGYDVIGQRMAQTIKYYLKAASYYRGPYITSAAFAGNRGTIDVQITHRNGNDFTPASGITGFSVLNNGSPVGINSAIHADASHIRLTLASSIPGGATATLRYMWGAAPDVSGIVKDNSSMALPLENTTADILVVSSNNNIPVAVNDTYNTSEDTALAVATPGVLVNDTDADGDTLTAVKVTNPSHGTVTLNSNGSFTYTPAANYNGSDSFTYKANDTKADSNTATVTITITPVNDAPVAANYTHSTTKNTTLTVAAPGVLSNDTDVDSSSLTAIKVTDPSHGAVTLNSNGSFAYTPSANYTGTDSFTYKANDGSLDSNIATVTITIAAVNASPVASNDSFTTSEDTALTVVAPGVLSNDTDADGDALTAIKVSNPSHGTVTLNSNGSFTYTPTANYNGSDSFTYKANDTKADSNTATVTITITPVNDAPVAANDTYSITKNTALTLAAPGVLSNDTDVDGDALTAIKVTDPSHGAVTLNSNGSFTYTPSANYTGTDSFTYKANDTKADSNTATVTITITDTVATFGLNSGNANGDDDPNYLSAVRFQNTAGTGTLTKLEILANDTTPSGKVRLGVYADNNGVPGALLLDAGEVTVTNGWVGKSGLSLSVTNGTYYWLAYDLQSANTLRYQSGQAANSNRWIARTYGEFPAQYPSGSGADNTQAVMRATVSK